MAATLDRVKPVPSLFPQVSHSPLGSDLDHFFLDLSCNLSLWRVASAGADLSSLCVLHSLTHPLCHPPPLLASAWPLELPVWLLSQPRCCLQGSWQRVPLTFPACLCPSHLCPSPRGTWRTWTGGPRGQAGPWIPTRTFFLIHNSTILSWVPRLSSLPVTTPLPALTPFRSRAHWEIAPSVSVELPQEVKSPGPL